MLCIRRRHVSLKNLPVLRKRGRGAQGASNVSLNLISISMCHKYQISLLVTLVLAHIEARERL